MSTMYAVIQTGGKQYRVQAGDILQIEKLDGEPGQAVKFDQVLLCAKPDTEASKIWLGQPHVSGASVQAEVVGQGRGEKILIIKMKRRKQYRRTQGHRQDQTQVLITAIENGAEKATLSAEEKKAKLATFHTQLKPKGLAHTPKTLGSRVRAANKKREAGKAAAAAKPAAKAKSAK